MWGAGSRGQGGRLGGCGGRQRTPSGWDLSLSPNALLISLTPAGEAFARAGGRRGASSR